MVFKSIFSPDRDAPSLLGGGKIVRNWHALLDFSLEPYGRSQGMTDTCGWRDLMKREIELQGVKMTTNYKIKIAGQS